MKLRSFKSYDEYVVLQSDTNRRKLNQIWVSQSEIRKLSKYLRVALPDARFGICHGVRNGFEVKELRRELGIEVIGTEISETAIQFPHVIQWDFHKVKDEWIGKVDFIYSNSWDHSFDPDLMLQQWLSCLKPNGLCMFEWSRNHRPSSVYGADCCGMEYSEFLSWLGQSCDVLKIMRVNPIPLSQAAIRPLRWIKYLVTPRFVVVARKKKAV
jgi:hypothetical protein